MSAVCTGNSLRTWPIEAPGKGRGNANQLAQTPHKLLPKLFGELRTRYLPREGGYTRVVRTEPKNEYDQGESAILELVDGPKDSRFMMTAKTVARDRTLGRDHTAVTKLNIKKVTQFRGEEDFEKMVQKFLLLSTEGEVKNEESLAEREAESLMDKDAAKAKKMAEGIVPESVRKAAQQKRSS